MKNLVPNDTRKVEIVIAHPPSLLFSIFVAFIVIVSDPYSSSPIYGKLVIEYTSVLLGKTYLRSKVESQVTASQAILNEKRHLLRQTEGHRGRQICSLAEVDEVLEGESKSDGFGERNRDVLLGLFDVRVLADGHGAAANVTLAGELDAFLGGLNDN